MGLDRICFRKIIVHPVAVQIASALAEVVCSDLDKVLGGVHVAEVAEALGLEIEKPFIVLGIGTPASYITSEGNRIMSVPPTRGATSVSHLSVSAMKSSMEMEPISLWPQLWLASS